MGATLHVAKVISVLPASRACPFRMILVSTSYVAMSNEIHCEPTRLNAQSIRSMDRFFDGTIQRNHFLSSILVADPWASELDEASQ